MAANLIDIVKQSLPADLIDKLGDRTDEAPASLEKAMAAGIPAILSALLNTASSPSGASRLANMLSGEEGAKAGEFLSAASGLMGGRMDDLLRFGTTILGLLFGGKQASVVDLISRVSGVKSSTATSLLAGLAPLVLGALKRQGGHEVLTPAGLTSFLLGQKSAITAAAPAGLADALGLNSLANLGQATADGARRTAGEAASYGKAAARQAAGAAGQGLSWLKWAVPLALFAAIGLWLLSNYWSGGAPGNPPVVAQVPAPPSGEQIGAGIREAGQAIGKAGEAVGETVGKAGKAIGETARDARQAVRDAASDAATSIRDATGKLTQLKLPGGINLDVPEGSALHNLGTYLTGAGGGRPATFNLQNFAFEGDTTAIQPESRSTLDKLATILKAFPTADLRIEGYTDAVGDPTANKRAMDRANAVKDFLVNAGVPSERITTEVVNPDRVVVESEGDRAKLGPIGLVVTKK
jgi:outer membrane protein OmpA-like peptidoglycan-associated protein